MATSPAERITGTGAVDDLDVDQRPHRGATVPLELVQGDRPVGVLSIGDLAIERDQTSGLADISAAEANQEDDSLRPPGG